MDIERWQHQEDLRRRHQRRLRALERQAATFGVSTPPEILTEIEDIQSQISQLDAELAPSISQPQQADTPQRALPSQTTTLIGRGQEVDEVCTLLQQAGVRLVTLTGPGGTGKTRLGLEVASELLDSFPDGIFFIALASISEPELVASAIAQALGVREDSGQTPREGIITFLSQRRVLLLVDNFEHVIDAAPELGDLLKAAPGLKILVTSRVVLRLYGEHEYIVPPLEIPNPEQLPSLEQLTQFEAVQLFIERALAVKSNFAVTNENAPAVAEICVQLEGLPLAIELAAARIKIFSPQMLLTKLSSRFKILTGGARDLPARQRTLRGAVDWSYELLEGDEKVLFARLAVFAGGFTLEAAEVVCDNDGDLPIDILDGLSSLLDKSLLKQVVDEEIRLRFVMLDTIREYAFEKLEDSGLAEKIRNKHLDFYLEYAEEISFKFQGKNGGIKWTLLEIEYDNLREALTWSQKVDGNETGLQLAVTLSSFWGERALYSEGRQWLASALEKNTEATPSLRANGLYQLGVLTYTHSNFSSAQTLFEQSLTLYRELNHQSGIAAAINYLGWVDFMKTDYTAARQQFEKSLALRRELGNKAGIADSLRNLGWIASVPDKDLEQARKLYEESLRLCQEVEHQSGIKDSLGGLGRIALEQGDYVTARTRLEEGLYLCRASGNKYSIASILRYLGRLDYLQGDNETAYDRLQESLILWREQRDTATMADVLHTLAHILLKQGHPNQARELLKESLTLCHEEDSRRIARCLVGLGAVAAAQGQPERGARLCGAAEAMYDPTRYYRLPDRVEYDSDVSAVCAHLDEETIESAWTAGQALTRKQLFAEALS